MPRLRAQANRLVVVCAVLFLLPAIVVAERLRRGAGRSLAGRAIRGVASVCGVTFGARVTEPLDPTRSYVLVPNHSSPLDIPAVLLADPTVRFLAAADLFRVPLLGAAMRAMGTEPVERHDPATAYRQLAALAGRGVPGHLVVFAEGGIPPAGERRPFKNGAFVLAAETGACVVPVVIHGSAQVLPPGGRLALRPGAVTVELLAPIGPPDGTVEDRDAVRERVQALVSERLATGPA